MAPDGGCAAKLDARAIIGSLADRLSFKVFGAEVFRRHGRVGYTWADLLGTWAGRRGREATSKQEILV